MQLLANVAFFPAFLFFSLNSAKHMEAEEQQKTGKACEHLCDSDTPWM